MKARDKSTLSRAAKALAKARAFDSARDAGGTLEWLLIAVKHGSPEAQWRLGVEHYNHDEFSEAAALFSTAAAQGYSSAQYSFAVMLMDGKGVERNPAKAVSLLRSASKAGLPNAQAMLGKILSSGDGVKQDLPEAFFWLYRAALDGDGDVNCQVRAACMMYNGSGTAKDLAGAFKLFSMAAKHDLPEAIFYVAEMLENGAGTAPDSARALELYIQAHKLRFLPATHRLGSLYYFGKNVGKDRQQALSYWREAAQQGYAESQYSLAYAMIETGELDSSKVIALLADATRSGHLESGNTLIRFVTDRKQLKSIPSAVRALDSRFHELGIAPQSQLLLAQIYLERGTGTHDHSRAIHWLVLAADAGDNQAQLLLGSLHFLGSGVDQDFEQAFELFRESATSGNERAKVILAAMHLEGIGTAKNPTLAAKLWRDQLDGGDYFARLHLAILFELGIGVKRDPSRSLDLLSYTPSGLSFPQDFPPFAADGSLTGKHDERYTAALGKLRRRNSRRELIEAVRAFRALARGGYAPALMMLGYLYQVGIGVERCLTTALDYYCEAAHQGYSPGRQFVQQILRWN